MVALVAPLGKTGSTKCSQSPARFVFDGWGVVLGVDGVADFDALHFGRNNDEVQLYAFDILALDGDDLRKLALSMRKANLERLLVRRPDAIFINPVRARRDRA